MSIGTNTMTALRPLEVAGLGRSSWLVAALSLVVTISFGFDFAYYNQNQYLLEAIRLLEPGTFARDWFTTQTTQYHGHFSRLLVWLAMAGPLDWMLTLLNSATIAGSVVLVWRIVRQIEPVGAPWVTAAIAGLFVVGQTETFANTYLLRSYGQPSGISLFLLLLATERFVAGRMLASGLALGAAGFMHLNYLVLGVLMFGLAQLLLGGSVAALAKRSLAQFWLAGLVLVVSLPTLLAASGGVVDVDLARHIYFHYRVPHHYLPQVYWPEMLPFLGWVLLAWPGVPELLRSGDAGRRCVVLYGSGLFVIALLHQATTWVFVPTVALLFVSRLAPLVQLLAQAIVLVALVRAVLGRDPEPARWRRVSTWACVAAGVLLVGAGLAFAQIPTPTERTDWVILGVAIAVSLLAALWVRRRVSPAAPSAPVVIAVSVMVVAVVIVACHSGRERLAASTFLHGPRDVAARGLYGWAQGTPRDTVFLIPPSVQDFRVQTRRAVVVDWKSVPGLPAEILEWHRRLQDETGLARVTSVEAADAAYAAMPEVRARALAARYDARFAVFAVRRARPAPSWCVASFANAHYVACRIDGRE